MVKINLGQTSPNHVSGSYTSQLYRNEQVSQDMKVLFLWSKKEAILENKRRI